MPGKMARSDPRLSVRVTRGAGSGQHLASVLQEGRKNANIDAGWDSSGESRLASCRGGASSPARGEWHMEQGRLGGAPSAKIFSAENLGG